MEMFFLVVFGIYMLFILLLLYGWEKVMSNELKEVDIYLSISVVIPFRNEASNLKTLIESLRRVDYPSDKVQFILVNDHSNDDSMNILKNETLTGLKIIELQDGKSGKKSALTAGITQSTSEIIVTSDADCSFNSNWLRAINNGFADEKVRMIVGGVAVSSKPSLFSNLQSIELASLIGSGASLLFWNIPAMANGANLAFRREDFLKLEGYSGNEHIASGDDEYLLRKFFSVYPEGILFNPNPNSVVTTKPAESLKLFFQQRIRWASKWKLQTNQKVKWLASIVFLFQLSFIALIVGYVLNRSDLLLTLFMSKIVLEAIFLFRVCQFLRVRLTLLPFMLLQVIYPFYVVITAIRSMFLTFEWKGRKY